MLCIGTVGLLLADGLFEMALQVSQRSQVDSTHKGDGGCLPVELAEEHEVDDSKHWKEQQAQGPNPTQLVDATFGDQPNALAIALAGNLRMAKERLKLLFNMFKPQLRTTGKPNVVSGIQGNEILEHRS
jgi:hypothetical protein